MCPPRFGARYNAFGRTTRAVRFWTDSVAVRGVECRLPKESMQIQGKTGPDLLRIRTHRTNDREPISVCH